MRTTNTNIAKLTTEEQENLFDSMFASRPTRTTSRKTPTEDHLLPLGFARPGAYPGIVGFSLRACTYAKAHELVEAGHVEEVFDAIDLVANMDGYA